MDSNFNNENEPWEFSLIIDDSDLHLTPVVRSSSSTHVEPSPYTPNPIRIIPSPAGIVQQAKMLKENIFILDSDRVLTPTQEYMHKVVEHVDEDDDFKSGEGLGFKPRRGGFPSGAKKEWGLSPKAKVRVMHTAQLDVTPNKISNPLPGKMVLPLPLHFPASTRPLSPPSSTHFLPLSYSTKPFKCSATAFTSPKQRNETELENKKYDVLKAIQDTQRGLVTTLNQRSEIEECLVDLESYEADNEAIDLEKLDGTWRLSYTSASDVLVLLDSSARLPFFQVGQIFQKFECKGQTDGGYIRNVVRWSIPSLLEVTQGGRVFDSDVPNRALDYMKYESVLKMEQILWKSMLARVQLRCIGAMTLEGYRKYVDKDLLGVVEAGFAVAEPSVSDTLKILCVVKDVYERHRGVRNRNIYLQFEEIALQNINISEELQALIAPALLPRSFFSLHILQAIRTFKAQVPVNSTSPGRRAVGGLYYLSYLDRNMLVGRAFRRKEFCLMTGLKFGVYNLKDFENAPIPLVQRIFPNRITPVQLCDLKAVFDGERFHELENEDVIRLCLVNFDEFLLLGREPRHRVESFLFALVEDLNAFDEFP
nr:probable plastid-lipid-associated protein 10, chloroplastic isoform X2 [Tanacetum cinerariifolium]